MTALILDCRKTYPYPKDACNQQPGLWGKIHRWRQHHKTRRALNSLTAEQLDDIGLSQTQARAEAAKPFWR